MHVITFFLKMYVVSKYSDILGVTGRTTSKKRFAGLRSCISATMFSTWTLYMSVLALLFKITSADQCRLHDVTSGSGSPVMDSLQCYNDYLTHARCTWEEEAHVHLHTAGNTSSQTLTIWVNKELETRCVSDGLGVLLSNGKVSHSCRYNSTRFSKSTSHTLYFKVPCVSKNTTFRVAQLGKVLSPIDLTEKVDGRGHLLSWRNPYPPSSNITRTLVYQLQYRRYGSEWIVVDKISASKYIIDKKSLLQGYSYEARVRAHVAIGLWSDWSPLVSWRTHNDGFFNLQCVIEGETIVTCSWQMKTEHSHFISYHLCGHENNSSLAFECCINPLLKFSDAELSEFSCSLKTSDPHLLTVKMSPVYFSRIFKTSKHIQLPRPDPVKVGVTDGIVKLTWSLPKVYQTLNFQIQLQIWTNKSLVSYNLTNGDRKFEIPSRNLNHSTRYQAHIRLLHIPGDGYVVRPSEWSQSTPFITDPASWSITTIIYVLVIAFVAVLFIILYNALPACHRRMELWKGSIPSPINSRVMEEMIKSSSGWPNLQSEKEKTSMCVLQITDDISICQSSVSGEPLLLHSEDMSLDTTIVTMGWSDGSNHLCSYDGEGMCHDKSGISFTGPYILCCEDASPQDKIFDVSSEGDVTCVPGKPENSAPINGGYIMTPPTLMPESQDSAPSKNSTHNPSDDPPAYTPIVDQGGMVLPHPSDYFMMPMGHSVGMGQSEPKGYVTLAQSEHDQLTDGLAL
ncbi:cytokine receptor common subunit beta-like isoform X2 [Xyrauchen texanus]|uniref:cytokine receptor common subunit beta-like isoform X2 n=1 Tax=Xyrauchen texanus TaxID=154827 RepID=UPI002242A261|nr:cytokine receptor common subunit beta-like isoform X2 [Xyrauchen texanus]